MRLLIIVPLLAACTRDASIATPTSGSMQRYVVDDFTYPTTDDQVKSFGSDLDGNGYVDNAIGDVLSALASQDDVRDDSSIRSLIGSGGVPSSIQIFDDDGDDANDIVGIEYLGTQTAGGAILRGSELAGGGIATLGLEAGSTTLLLPVFLDAVPTPVELAYSAIEMSPDGSGGFDVRIQGLAEPAPLASAACVSMLQMIAADPQAYDGLVAALSNGSGGVVTQGECVASRAIHTLLAPDVTGPDQQPYVSLGIGAHVFVPRDIPPAI
jgi:hypothetical protein